MQVGPGQQRREERQPGQRRRARTRRAAGAGARPRRAGPPRPGRATTGRTAGRRTAAPGRRRPRRAARSAAAARPAPDAAGGAAAAESPRPHRARSSRAEGLRDPGTEIGARPRGHAPMLPGPSPAGAAGLIPATFGPTGRRLAACRRAVVYWPRVTPLPVHRNRRSVVRGSPVRRPAPAVPAYPLDLAAAAARIAVARPAGDGMSEQQPLPVVGLNDGTCRTPWRVNRCGAVDFGVAACRARRVSRRRSVHPPSRCPRSSARAAFGWSAASSPPAAST